MLLFLMISHLFRALRWKYLLKPIKSSTTFIHFFEATMIGYFANNIFPRAGEIAKAYALSKEEKISKASSLASVVLERILDILFSLFFFGIAIVWNRKIFEKYYPWLGKVALVGAFTVGIFLILIFILLMWRDRFLKLFDTAFALLGGRLSRKFRNALESFIFGFEALRYSGIYKQVIGLSFLIYICYILSAYVPLFAFEIEKEKVNFFTALTIFVVSTIGFILPTPGGIGSYHSFITGTLTKFYNIQHEVALGYAVLTHGINYLASSIFGIYFAVKKQVKVL